MAGIPGDPMTSYVGAASGGLWKTIDGGDTWRPIFDDQPVSSMGSIAIAPSDPNVVWVGTGETFVIRPAHSLGDGVYKSTDAGATWTNVGLPESGRIGRMVVDPRLYGRLSALASDLNANGADFPPTVQQIEVHTQFKQQLVEYTELYLELMNDDAAQFRQLLRELGFPDIISALLPER